MMKKQPRGAHAERLCHVFFFLLCHGFFFMSHVLLSLSPFCFMCSSSYLVPIQDGVLHAEGPVLGRLDGRVEQAFGAGEGCALLRGVAALPKEGVQPKRPAQGSLGREGFILALGRHEARQVVIIVPVHALVACGGSGHGHHRHHAQQGDRRQRRTTGSVRRGRGCGGVGVGVGVPRCVVNVW